MENFPIGVHVIFIPLSIFVGFLLGWIVRGVVARDPRRRGQPPGSEPPR